MRKNSVIIPGTVTARTLEDDPELPYFLVVPEHVRPETPVFVSVHGRSRRASKHAELFAPLAQRQGVVLVAPLFPRVRFPSYNCLRRPGGERADQALGRILAEVGQVTGARTDRMIYLFGYSGGAQFAHRYAMAYPEQIAGGAVGAPGWYTFPDPAVEYPCGLKLDGSLPGVVFDPARFLRIAMLVLVGAGDTQRDPHLNQDPRVDAQQGMHRMERAHRWVTAMQNAAKALEYDTQYTLQVLPGVAHSFEDCMTQAGMGETVFAHLFGAPPVRGVASGDGPGR